MMWHVVPAIRRALVNELKKKGLRQKEIAVLMGITEPAVSNYVKDKRATMCNACLSTAFEQEISKATDKILKDKNPDDVVREINRLCLFVKEKKIICDIHRSKDIKLKGCEICYT